MNEVPSIKVETPKVNHYVVARGRKLGIFMTWNLAEKQVKNFRNAHFRKFASEYDAMNWFTNQTGERVAALYSGSDTVPDKFVTLEEVTEAELDTQGSYEQMMPDQSRKRSLRKSQIAPQLESLLSRLEEIRKRRIDEIIKDTDMIKEDIRRLGDTILSALDD